MILLLKLFIADDEYFFRQALKTMLDWGALGVQICGEASNGEDALAQIRQMNPEIIFIDINIPVINGLDMATTLRNEGNDSEMLILTGYSEFEYAKRSIDLNVCGYILKPVDKDELLSMVKKIIKKYEILGQNTESAENDLLQKNEITRESNRAKLVINVIQYINKHYKDSDLTVESIAEALFVNYQYLCQIFKKETGDTINGHINSIRMINAKSKFDDGVINITAVAASVGYPDSSYFSKCFKKRFGISPSKYVGKR